MLNVPQVFQKRHTHYILSYDYLFLVQMPILKKFTILKTNLKKLLQHVKTEKLFFQK